MNLSIILITLNAAEHIERCLRSVQFPAGFDYEVIVVDGGSRDDTVTLSQNLGANVYVHTDWLGFGVQKNRALSYARADWVLSLDADEMLTDALCQEIYDALSKGDQNGDQMPRLSQYCGRWIYHSGWRPDYVLRLFKRSAGRFSDDLVHERVILTPPKMGTLRADLRHYSINSLEEAVNKMNHYSSAGAQSRFLRGKNSNLGLALLGGFWAFFRTYVLRCGFLDGAEGVMLAISNAQGTYYRHVKLRALHRAQSKR